MTSHLHIDERTTKDAGSRGRELRVRNAASLITSLRTSAPLPDKDI
jgi:hypothetical protein